MELPEELVCEIMHHLPQHDLGRFTQVCRDLNRIGTEDGIWRKKGLLKRCNQTSFAGSTDNVPTPRLCHSMVVYNSKIYIMGGHNTEAESQRFSEVKNDLYTYDLVKRSWEKATVRNMPNKTEHCTVVYRDKLWMFGGYSGHTFSNSLYMLHLATGSHSSLVKAQGELPTGRSALVGGVYGDKLYIFGGWDGIIQNNDFYSFDFNTSTWTRIPSSSSSSLSPPTTPPISQTVDETQLPFARCSHTMAISNERKSMYIFGGYGGKTRNYLNDLWSYNFETQSWTCIQAKGEIPSPRSRMRMIEWNSKLYMFGGWDKTVHYDDLFEFDIESSCWSKIEIGISKSDDSCKIGQHSMVVEDNILYIFGGFNVKQKKSTNDLFCFRLGKSEKTIDRMSDFDTATEEVSVNSLENSNNNSQACEDVIMEDRVPRKNVITRSDEWMWM